jgi:tetratricopeptide (TPR) repeat protein
VIETEIGTMRQRQNAGEDVRIYSIILSPVPNAALAQLKDAVLRPKDGHPLSLMSKNDREVAMAGIADDIAAVAKDIADKKRGLTEALSDALVQLCMSSYVPAEEGIRVDTAHLPETPYERLVGRDDELKRLDDAWTNSQTNIVSLIAEGGAGKSALVNEWLVRLRNDNYRGAEAVLGWSFYSQGSKERATAADEFLNWALDELGIEIETTSATAKGEAIAEAMVKRRVLLVLDGVEPLQHGLDTQLGDLKDQGLRVLLRRFASTPPNREHGLIVLTSRLPVKDIARWQDSGAPLERLDKLSDVAGTALLRDNGVWGTDKELKAAAHDFGGHALALGLLASFLKETQNGDVRRRDHIRGLLADADNPGHDHAKRVMESYEKEWLTGQPVLLAIMHMVGLFDRPASDDCLDALRAERAIPGLTDRIVGLSEDEWQRAVTRLREVRLLAPADPAAPDALDTHPLVREWFGDRLKKTNEAAWKAAHGRLYEHLRDTTKEGNTPTLEDLVPLYQAIPHGCQAGRYSEAREDIFIERICRRRTNGKIAFYAVRMLGSLASDLAAISYFFNKLYEEPASELVGQAPAWILGQAAFYLRAQGRVAEALPAMRAALKMDEGDKFWNRAVSNGLNLVESELLSGNIGDAVATAKQSVVHADEDGDAEQMMSTRTSLANAMEAGGRREEAERLFNKAERLQEKRQPAYPILYSIWGYHYCDLLLAKGAYVAALNRASRILRWENDSDPILDRGWVRLILGRAFLCRGLKDCTRKSLAEVTRDSTRAARVHLDEAIEMLRSSGQNDEVPRGLLARASFRKAIAAWDGATRDLDEVEEIAEPGPMRLYLCDMALQRARLAFARIEAFAPLNGLLEKDNAPKPVVPSAERIADLKSETEKQLKIAADYIETCSYHRRDEELAELQAVLRGERKFADLPPRV